MRTRIVEFNPVFKAANKTRARYRVLMGSAGSGKSKNTAQDYILKLSDPAFTGANLLVIRKVEVSHRDSTYAELTSAIFSIFGDEWPLYWDITTHPLRLRSKITGGTIIFRGMKDDKEREKVKSINVQTGKINFIWVEEATELQEADIDILDDRLRGILPENLYYQMTFTFNPISSSHWIKRRLWDYQDDDIFKNHSTYLQNRFIDDGYKKRMERRRIMDPDGYRVYGLGEWGEVGGLILTNYEIAEIPQDPRAYDFISYGQDFGYNHANAILEIGHKDGNIYILREIYVFEHDTSEIISIAKSRGFDPKILMYCDAAEPDRIKQWKKAGFMAVAAKKGAGSVKSQIDTLKQHKIYIHPQCTNTIKEAQQWKWKKDENSGRYIDQPIEFFDDAMAALRYGIEPIRRNVSFGATRRL